ncbi:ku bact: ku protein [Lucifera butyrica]|uniref:Non-homologous end joining protein Ku n=1 Tax=Lucifera butyrica TaxID=1351585 RepID=A0A498RHQ4_9FIRM|nr:Ku protein [Lucifera butyrica]VBB08678.1 ku bact: ku protein [Lucifera butyrica]
MPRPIWSGAISFGLVNIPVKLFNAVKKKTLHFHQLRRSDACRIRLKRVCALDDKEVPAEEIVKGYELSSNQYVVVTNEELEALSPEASRGIEIEDFVQWEQIDPVYFEHSYYLIPDKGAGKAYTLLLSAMQKTKKVALARFILRSKQYLAAIRPAENLLVLATMFFADEVVAREELNDLPASVEPPERELKMAEQLIESLASDFAPAKYQDEYREKVLAMIERKAEGEQTVTQPAAQEKGKVIDLMAALEASLAAIKDTPAAKPRRKKSRA